MIRLFRVSIPTSVLVLILSDTLLLFGCYIAGAFLGLNSFLDPWDYLRYDNGWFQVLLVVAILQIGFYFMDLYDDLRLRSSRVLLINNLLVLLGVAFLFEAL